MDYASKQIKEYDFDANEERQKKRAAHKLHKQYEESKRKVIPAKNPTIVNLRDGKYN